MDHAFNGFTFDELCALDLIYDCALDLIYDLHLGLCEESRSFTGRESYVQ